MPKLFTIAAATLALAGAANADFFFIGSEGDFSGAGDPVVGSLSTTVGTQFGPYAFETVEGEFSAALGDPGDPGDFSGEFMLFGPDDSILTIAAEGTADNGVGPDFFSYAGTWEVIGATGVYEGLTGAGDLSGSHFFEGPDVGFVSLQIQGVLVPAPGAAMVLGLGFVLSHRRRR